MTGSDVPRGVRVITLLAWLMVPAGVLLVCAGILDLTWWGSADAARLTSVMAAIKDEYGVNEPALIRRGDGAVTLIVLGVVGMAYGLLAPMIRRGRRWARSWALGVGFAFFLVVLMGIGADASQPSYLKDYYETLTWTTQTERIAEVKALVYPAGYAWFEDFAQGLAAAAALAVVVGLSWAAVAHADYFVGFRIGKAGAAGTSGEPDEWDAALARIRSSGGIDAVHHDRAGGSIGRNSTAGPRPGAGVGGSTARSGPGADGGGGSTAGSRGGAVGAGDVSDVDEEISRLYRRPSREGMGGNVREGDRSPGPSGAAGGGGASGLDDEIDRLYRRPPRSDRD
ncbi:hypothetical protein AB0J83_06395 [Actinoplanes sp. NPDC049596]|uniref:hypothetical protein n=1 Tax=unclassified Actinoplanes TaxID=2626549 RepID=UPI00341AA068